MNTINEKTVGTGLDELIAQTVYVLNEKGYKTISSCSGHDETYKKYYYFYTDFNTVNQMNLTGIEIVENENGLSLCRYLAYCNNCYIYFADDYVFESFPKYFVQKGRIFASSFSYLNFDGSKKSEEEVQEHIKKINKELYLWSSNLPYIDSYSLKK